MDVEFLRNILRVIMDIIRCGICDFVSIGRGREIELQNLIYYRLVDRGLGVRRRVVLEGLGKPRVEVDLLVEDLVAVEVKCDRRFYEGIGQVLAVKEFYGKYGVLLHLVDDFSGDVLDGLRVLGNKYGFSVMVIRRQYRDLIVYW